MKKTRKSYLLAVVLAGLLSHSLIWADNPATNLQNTKPVPKIPQNETIRLQEDNIAPRVVFDISKRGILDVTITDDHSGVKEVIINADKIKGNAAEHFGIDMKKYGKKEYIYVYSTDFAGNRSPIHIIINPYYDEEATDMIANIKQSEIGLKKKITTSKQLPIKHYPIVKIKDKDGIIRHYYISHHPKDLDVIDKVLREDGATYSCQSITRFESYRVAEKKATLNETSGNSTNDFKQVFTSLPREKFYNKDNYKGTLLLKIEDLNINDGTVKNTNKTQTHTITYPGLSNADSSLIPKETTVNGRTYFLSNIKWNTASDEIDYNDSPKESGFTAIATYTRNYTKTDILDYVVNATYEGDVFSLLENETIYELQYKKDEFVPKQDTPKPNVMETMFRSIGFHSHYTMLYLLILIIIIALAGTFIAMIKSNKVFTPNHVKKKGD